MTAERLTGDWERRYLGPRIFTCVRCGATYQHDAAYLHAIYECGKARNTGQAMTREDRR